ncbi:hypothetical protein J6590_068489 [Homalodisca vitripennis]|nr:hypothetical protein J6590_068489 [Homalodisca vitripennis]
MLSHQYGENDNIGGGCCGFGKQGSEDERAIFEMWAYQNRIETFKRLDVMKTAGEFITITQYAYFNIPFEHVNLDIPSKR